MFSMYLFVFLCFPGCIKIFNGFLYFSMFFHISKFNTFSVSMFFYVFLCFPGFFKIFNDFLYFSMFFSYYSKFLCFSQSVELFYVFQILKKKNLCFSNSSNSSTTKNLNSKETISKTSHSSRVSLQINTPQLYIKMCVYLELFAYMRKNRNRKKTYFPLNF